MCLAALVSIVFLALTSFLFAQESLPQGRYLSDGRWQPRNSHASLGSPANRSYLPDDALAHWGLDRRIAPRLPDCSSYYDPTLATSDGQLLSVVFNDVGCGYALHLVQSTDGGWSWGEEQLFTPPGGHNAYNITSAVSDSLIYFAYRMAYNLIGINLRRSTDGGRTWLPNQFIDANFYQGSAGPGIVARDSLAFITFSHAGVRMGRQSHDRGATWSENIFNSDSSGVGVPDRLALNGAGLHLTRTYGVNRIQEVHYKRSTDWGATWGEDVRLSTFDVSHSFWPRVCAWGDSSVAVAWCDYMYSPYDFNGDIIVRVSRDNGETWGPGMALTDDHLSHDCDIEARGDTIDIVFTKGAWDQNSELYFRQSTDAGLTWSEPEQLTDAEYFSENPDLLLHGDRIYLAWADSRDDAIPGGYHRDIYFKMADNLSRAGDSEISIPAEPKLSAYPNPFNSSTTITVSGMTEAEIAIYDITGRRIATLKANDGRAVWEASALSSGVYFARVIGEKAGRALRLVLVR